MANVLAGSAASSSITVIEVASTAVIVAIDFAVGPGGSWGPGVTPCSSAFASRSTASVGVPAGGAAFFRGVSPARALTSTKAMWSTPALSWVVARPSCWPTCSAGGESRRVRPSTQMVAASRVPTPDVGRVASGSSLRNVARGSVDREDRHDPLEAMATELVDGIRRVRWRVLGGTRVGGRRRGPQVGQDGVASGRRRRRRRARRGTPRARPCAHSSLGRAVTMLAGHEQPTGERDDARAGEADPGRGTSTAPRRHALTPPRAGRGARPRCRRASAADGTGRRRAWCAPSVWVGTGHPGPLGISTLRRA